MDDPQNRPAGTPKEQTAPTVPTDAPAPHPVASTGGGLDSDTIDVRDDPRQDAPRDESAANDPKDIARQEGEQVAEDAREQVREVADTAREGVAEVTEEAKHQAIDLAEDARRQLHDEARRQTDHLGNAIQELGHKLHLLAEGRSDEAGQVTDYTDRIADQVDRIGDRVQELGFDGTVDELQRFARRRPGVFLLGAAAAGFAVSRLGRGAKDAQQQQPDGDGRSELQDERAGGSLLSSEQQHVSPRAGQPPLEGQGPAASPMSSPTVGDVPSDVPPPPPAVPAPDPTMPRGRP